MSESTNGHKGENGRLARTARSPRDGAAPARDAKLGFGQPGEQAVSDGPVELPLSKADFSSDQETRWCPGCGDYAILASVQSFMPELGIPPEKIVFVTGIGCAGRFVYYMDTYGMHGIHGRAPALATGVATSRPDLSVWVVSGDGDALSIGGNHLIHALRRNVPLKILLFNNQIYGLTKGQYSPTSEEGKVTKSTPFGSQDHPFNPVSLALGAEASFVARTVDTDKTHVAETLRAAAAHQGAAFVEIYQNCNVFNDGAFDAVRAKGQKEHNQIRLVHGEPIRFGADGERGVTRGADGRLELVDVAEAGEDASLCTTPSGPSPASPSSSRTSPPDRPARRRSASSARSRGPSTAASLRSSWSARAPRSAPSSYASCCTRARPGPSAEPAALGREVHHELVDAVAGVMTLEMVGQPAHQLVRRLVVARHRGGEAANAEATRACGEQLGERRADPAPLPVVGDHDRNLGGVGVVGETNEACDRDQAANRLSRILDHQCHMIAAVHFGQVPQLRPAEAALGCEEAPLHTLCREVPQPVLQHALVVRADRPDQDRGSVWKAPEHT